MSRRGFDWARGLAFVLVGVCSAHARAQGRVALADVELEGPLGDILFDMGDAGRTVVHGGVRAGERVRLLVPLSTRDFDDRRVPLVRALDPRGPAGELEVRARFLGWRAEGEARSRLPATLRARPRPPVDVEQREIPRAAIGLVVATFLFALALRRRPLSVLLLGVGSSAGLFVFVPGLVSPAAASPSVLDGDRDQATWIWRSGARFTVGLEFQALDGEHFDVEVEPSGVPIEWSVDVRASASFRARAAGARLWIVRPMPARTWIFDPASNHAESFRRAWIRTDGEWREFEGWGNGQQVLDPIGHRGPPGWLATGLPQGVNVIIGEALGAPAEGPAFVRVTGL